MDNQVNDLGKKIWDLLLAEYRQVGRVNVEVPTPEVMFILCGVMANVLSAVRSTQEREQIIGKIPMQVDILVKKISGGPGSRLILPH